MLYMNKIKEHSPQTQEIEVEAEEDSRTEEEVEEDSKTITKILEGIMDTATTMEMEEMVTTEMAKMETHLLM